MVRLREIPRTAAFAWSSDTAKPLLVTGTRAGAVDADFSDETKLELWNLNLDNENQGLELQPIGSVTAESRFYDIAWGLPNDEHPRGLIAGALENGSLTLWDAAKLIDGASEALVFQTTAHSGAIKSLQFNPQKPQILATAGVKGELFIFDTADLSKDPIRLGTAAARADDIECVAWNRKVAHILATGGAGGFVTVWDLKTKKASLTLNNNRKAVSAIAWDPTNSTKLLTATSDDNTPVIYLWDLRNSNAPERTLQGHEQGVLSLSWCQQDPDLLLSCGKDNRTLVWNPHTGERFGEFPEVTNWTFLTRFNPHNPNLSATASFDGKITIQTLQNTNPPSAGQTGAQSTLDGDDFFAQAQSQPQGASFSLPKAPSWFERPVSVSFGFGGKIVVVRKNTAAAGQPRSSQIRIAQFSVDPRIGDATEKFEGALKSGDVAAICESHVDQVKTDEEKAEWQILQTLSTGDGRTKIVEHLGFASDSDEEQTSESADASGKKDDKLSPPASNGVKGHKKGFSSLWADGEDADDFLSELTATKEVKTDNPFYLLSEGNTALEDSITKALLVGNFEKAVDICIEQDRMADAFIIANCGGKELLEKVQSAYLTSKSGSPSYLRLLASVITKNLWDVVYNADLANWKETMVSLCTYADPSEFPDLCESLGDRILEKGSRKDACFCYLVGSKLEKVVNIWISELEESEQAALKDSNSDSDSTFSVHARSLQQFIEKVTVFRHVTKFADSETTLSSGWKLAALYDKYTEYADIVAAHGQLDVAQKYLDLLPNQYPAAEVARNRVKLATQKAAPRTATATRQQPAASRVPTRQQPATLGYQAPSAVSTPAAASAPNLNPYTPQQPPTQAAFNPYAPPAQTPYQAAGQQPAANPYAPQGVGYAPSPPSVSGYAPPAPSYGQPTPYGAPPRATQQPAAPPPPKAKDVGDWNDVPMVTKPPTRKSTPRVAPITSPFPNQPNITSPPPTGGFQRGAPTPPPPPPKGPAPPRNISSPVTGPPQIARPPSSAANQYAPPPPPAGGFAPPAATVPRTASPYNPPPAAAAPPPSRYAPAPAAQQYNQPPAQAPLAPPPAVSQPPPRNPYAPAAQPTTQPGQYAPSPFQAAPPQASAPPPMAPPPSATGPPPAARPTPAPPPARAAPPKAKYPPGDRTHIPESAQRLVDILDRDMQRVASKAPASFAPQVRDTQKRLGLLFDDLNNQLLVKPDTVEQLTQLAEALEARNYDAAHKLQVDIQREKTEQCGNWMVGVKRLIGMSKATP
ncbi:protein transport protein S31 [Coniochaeta pulveracea]|uniref:Protein transport protein SEC31 n=1 Tax=Coniochaeta pulveracea TaxID=177199 RepID=A0A420Y7M9_9PEZI|nr:protein transport protein S31 [Coniochaeta pulveracea]